MAYYNNYYPYQQPYQQFQQTFQQPSSIIWVRNQAEAIQYPIAPNNAIALWDTNSATVYLKQADASGRPTMKTYDLVERFEKAADSANESANKNDTYATKDDVAALTGVVKGYEDMISTLKADMEKMSKDLYGIAGKKTKKEE